MLESAWPISTRPRLRRMARTIVASGARSHGLMETAVLLEQSSRPTSPPSPWYLK
ncbi:unnamed protein product [Linum tenue]|nr:unnamed protein product [Linum tenue]